MEVLRQRKGMTLLVRQGIGQIFAVLCLIPLINTVLLMNRRCNATLWAHRMLLLESKDFSISTRLYQFDCLIVSTFAGLGARDGKQSKTHREEFGKGTLAGRSC